MLNIIPISLAEANEFVRIHHWHHQPVSGAKFQVAAANGDKIAGVAIVGRPVARMNDDGWTLEVTRVATDGTRNACSALYGACRRAAWALGYRRLITYTLPEEGGKSLRGAGWRPIGTLRKVVDSYLEWEGNPHSGAGIYCRIDYSRERRR